MKKHVNICLLIGALLALFITMATSKCGQMYNPQPTTTIYSNPTYTGDGF
jgi:hypothetical protein